MSIDVLSKEVLFDTAPVIFVVKLRYTPFNNVIVVVVVVDNAVDYQ